MSSAIEVPKARQKMDPMNHIHTTDAGPPLSSGVLSVVATELLTPIWDAKRVSSENKRAERTQSTHDAEREGDGLWVQYHQQLIRGDTPGECKETPSVPRGRKIRTDKLVNSRTNSWEVQSVSTVPVDTIVMHATHLPVTHPREVGLIGGDGVDVLPPQVSHLTPGLKARLLLLVTVGCVHTAALQMGPQGSERVYHGPLNLSFC